MSDVSNPGEVRVHELTDGAAIRPIHLIVLSICFLTSVVDGLDTQAIGFSAPAIAAAHGIPFSSFGVIFTAGTLATLLGAATLGPVADRIGRRKMLIICTLIFGVFTAATPLATDVLSLSVVRFIGGLGLGGALPCFLTLVSEYAPQRRKALATGLLWCGYPLGGVIGGVLGSQFLADGGWEAIFYLGGGLAIVVAALQLLFLPESLQFLAVRGEHPDKIAQIARRIAPDFNLAGRRIVAERSRGQGAAVKDVFAEDRTVPTILLWTALFMTFTLTKFMVLWMPGLLQGSGMALSTAALMLALANFASLPSMALAGFLLDRVGPYRVLPVTYALLAIAFIGLSLSLGSTPLVAVAVILIGLLQGPGIAGMLHLTTALYPTNVRSTGVGIAMGVGRSGQVVASGIVGAVIALGMGTQSMIATMSVPPILALLCVVALSRHYRKRALQTPPVSAGHALPAE